MLKIVLDTNVLLVSISGHSELHWVFRSLLEGKYTLCVTTEILNEYAEIIEREMGWLAAESTLGVIENLENVEFVTRYFRFDVLSDKDDNKFLDCAIAANADFIVSHDKSFRKLKKSEFPKVQVIVVDEFGQILSHADL